jgi:hypothetical protein
MYVVALPLLHFKKKKKTKELDVLSKMNHVFPLCKTNQMTLENMPKDPF